MMRARLFAWSELLAIYLILGVLPNTIATN